MFGVWPQSEGPSLLRISACRCGEGRERVINSEYPELFSAQI